MRRAAEIAVRTINKVTDPFREIFLPPLILARETKELQSPRIARLLAATEGAIMGLFVTQALWAGASSGEAVACTALGWGSLSILTLAQRSTNLIEKRGRERIQDLEETKQSLARELNSLKIQRMFPMISISWN